MASLEAGPLTVAQWIETSDGASFVEAASSYVDERPGEWKAKALDRTVNDLLHGICRDCVVPPLYKPTLAAVLIRLVSVRGMQNDDDDTVSRSMWALGLGDFPYAKS